MQKTYVPREIFHWGIVDNKGQDTNFFVFNRFLRCEFQFAVHPGGLQCVARDDKNEQVHRFEALSNLFQNVVSNQNLSAVYPWV